MTARRGTTGWEVRVTGTPAHSSQIFRDDIGYGAVYEMARILNAFREKLAGEAHLTFNPGVLLGGTSVEFDPVQTRGTAFGKTNVIAEHAVASGDLRALSREQFENARKTMTEIVGRIAAAYVGDDHVRRRLSADGADRWQRKAARRCTTRPAAISVLGPSPPSAPIAPGAADVSFVAGDVKTILDGVGSDGSATITPRRRPPISARCRLRPSEWRCCCLEL